MLDLIHAYENYLSKVKKASDNTVASYMRDIRQFSTWLDEHTPCSLIDVSADTLLEYLTFLDRSGKSNATASRSVASLKNFYAYLVSSGFIESNPISSIHIEREEKKLPQILSGLEIELLLAQPICTDAKGYRDKAMLELMYATGIRVSELIALNIDDVALSQGIIKCTQAKKSRTIPLYPAALRAMKIYIRDIRNSMLADGFERALFVNVNGCRMTRQGFWKILKHYQETAGINKEITPHTLRHSFAVHLLENGADLSSLKELMGHSDISSTQMYTHMVDQKIKSVYEKCHPKF